MREIKFRAWDKLDKVMHDWECVKSEFTMEYFDDEGLVFQQYTGLKDKNGIEIYEGDVVRVTLKNKETFISRVKWFDDEDYPAFDLYQVNEAFYFESNVLSTVFNDGSEIEVIGNIYENEELLNER